MTRHALQLVALAELAVGFVLTAFAAIFNEQASVGDGANIGAGIVFLLGLLIGVVGLVLAAISLFVGRRRGPTPSQDR